MIDWLLGIQHQLASASLGVKLAVIGTAALSAGAVSGGVAMVVVDGGSSGESSVVEPTRTHEATQVVSDTSDEPINQGSGFDQEGADSPEAAVQLLLDGITENNQDKVLDATDPDYRDETIGAGNFRLLFQGLFSFFTGADIGQPEITFRDISMYAEYEEDPSFATVYVSGRMRALGREESLNAEPTPAVKKFGRWFVTTEEGSYAGQIEKEQEALAAATAEAERAAAAAAATQEAEDADWRRTHLPELLSISLGPAYQSGSGPVEVYDPETLEPTTMQAPSFSADLTVANTDSEPHTIWLTIQAHVECPAGYDLGYWDHNDRQSDLSIDAPADGQVTTNAAEAWQFTSFYDDGYFAALCYNDGGAAAVPLGVTFSIVCHGGVTVNSPGGGHTVEGPAIGGIPWCYE